MGRNDQRAQLSQTGSSDSKHHGRMDHGLKCRIDHGKVIGNILGGDIRKTCGTLSEHRPANTRCQVFEHSSNRCIDEAKERRRSWKVRQSSHAREYDFGVQSTHFSALKSWIQNKMPVHIRTSSLELNPEDTTALANHRPQGCAVDEHVLHHEQ